MKTLIVIPYNSSGAQGCELEFAVAGWRRHFKESYQIVLAGESHPIVDTGNDIVCIESPRVPERPGQYRQHLDYVSCLKKVREAFPKHKGFVMVADDTYAVNDFGMIDILMLKAADTDIRYDAHSPNPWRRDAMKTRARLIADGYPTRNFTTHLPQYFEWSKVAELWERYDMENESYVIEDLYYNIFFPDRIPFILNLNYDNFKCGVYEQNFNFGFIKGAFKSKIWINNSPNGWSPQLERALEAHFYGDRR